jgi:hypothetical protein
MPSLWGMLVCPWVQLGAKESFEAFSTNFKVETNVQSSQSPKGREMAP